MTSQISPYLCHDASGTLIPGITTRHTRGKPHLIRQPLTRKPRTTYQLARTRFLTALGRAWSYYFHRWPGYWPPPPGLGHQDAYHDYVSLNIERFNNGLWPTCLYPPDPTVLGPNALAPALVGLERGLAYYNRPAIDMRRCYTAACIVPDPRPHFSPHEANFWDWDIGFTYNPHYCLGIPAGDYYVHTLMVNMVGTAGTMYRVGPIAIAD